jgi:hypothetical protein
MKKLLGIACAAALTLAPAASATDKQKDSQAHKDAVQTCKEMRKAAGKQAFRQLYGKNGIGHCVKQETRENAAEQEKAEETAQKNAAKECKAEREADPEGFREQYGTKPYSTKPGKGNAFGKCVSQKAKAQREEQEQEDAQEDEAQVDAAQECKEERKADREAFEEQYGTNRNKRNAFGKCVSQKVREQESTEGS